MMRLFAVSTLALVVSFASTETAQAGATVLERDGEVVVLECKENGCFVMRQAILGSGKSSIPQYLGPGGRKNFIKWSKTMRRQGWKPQ